ncbi:MAG: thioredoxin-dependent thiol peroxidase [Actinomycetota bacterium]|nr:thioredoxin-dependent thiol peroxidase [Actinomycetota bacterium]
MSWRKAMADAPKPGDLAPGFTLKNQDGQDVSLSDYAGKRVVLYFYPKDFTPGCTTEACDFRDLLQARSLKADAVIGISADPPAKHADFAREYSLPFPLLSDPGHEVMSAYGAYGEKQNYGKTVVGVIRSTFVIGPDGRIEQAFTGVKAKGHAARIAAGLA